MTNANGGGYPKRWQARRSRALERDTARQPPHPVIPVWWEARLRSTGTAFSTFLPRRPPGSHFRGSGTSPEAPPKIPQ